MPLTADERAAIKHLASDIPALWTAPTTAAADRQAIARLMLERVVVTVQGESEAVLVAYSDGMPAGYSGFFRIFGAACEGGGSVSL